MLALALSGSPGISQAKDRLIWLLRDMPPATIFSGPYQGQGAIDQFMPVLTARMPEYEHVLMRVNRARSTQMLNDPTLTCDPTLLWTATRAKTIVFSIPTYIVFSNGLVVRKNDMALFTPFIADGHIDLRALLDSKTIKLGVVAERSYGSVIDETLSHTPRQELNEHYGNDAVGSLLQMERLGRLQALISYWPEARAHALLQGISPEELTFLPVKNTPKYQFTHIGCSDTPQGRQAMEIINREMRTLRETSLLNFYANWLEPESRTQYILDAKAFFETN
ncbi:TIGR02285 family protein [Pseudomonas cichorii]|uniref:TIGR02285 family protein n=1 Tax=Pseudomonas cichorii TaxID=36746 RepID=UPI001C8AD9D7|nr:TIGR02285 family protein [Pseudomonas cichorii]MBX8496539.1 TIGR02285 family protein [Pseudomonas cichorii]MBX8514731.1 TIGR02285 family protein [Pseudomonas cichorii]MBX8588452.1 TIGR02285 family protein [Pseudomonas cichorii]